MGMYDEFASVYDEFMRDAPYDQWLALLSARFQLDQLDVVDVGCGTGTLTIPVALSSRSCIGIDVSDAMLSRAQVRAIEARARVQWMCQDIRQLRLPKRVNLVLATCDVLNYLGTEQDIQATLQAIAESLCDGGIFGFDVIGPRRLLQLNDGYWHQIEENAVILHETTVQGHEIWHDVHAFVDENEGLYRRIEERHHQVYYPMHRIETLLEEAGFCLREMIGDFGLTDVQEADRVIVLAEK